MSLRVTQQAVGRAALAAIRQASDDLGVVQEQLATSRRINRLSDAPLDVARAHRLRADTTKIEQYTRNLEQAQHEIDFTASVLQGVSDIFVEAGDICIRAADASTDASEREALGFAVQQFIDTLVRSANADYNGHYIFAGNATSTTPFVAEPDGSQVAYQGNSQSIELDIGPRARVETSEPGTRVFGGSGGDACTFDALIELRDLLYNTDGLDSGDLSAALSDHVGEIRAAHDRVTDAAARFGWRSSQVELTRTVLDNVALANTQEISALEDTDYAEAATLLYRHEVALETALAVAARMMRNNLLDYLK